MIEYRMEWSVDDTSGGRRAAEEAFRRLREERTQGRAGYYDLPFTEDRLVEKLEEERERRPLWREAESVVVVGIGGSSLGAKAVDRALRPLGGELKRMLFLENPDPLELQEKFAVIDPERSLFLVISKSGGTIETVTLFKLLIDRFGLEPEGKDRERILVVTDPGSILERYAGEYGLECYNLPRNVGGRFSVLSAVGLVPLTLAGHDTLSLLEGARRMVGRFFGREADHILEKGAYLVRHRNSYRMNALFAYGSSLEDLTKWYVQLWGESLGKIDARGQKVGLTPIGNIGSVDQHSFLQLIIQGPRDKTVTFLKVREFDRDLRIPEISLKHIGHTDFVNGRTVGELLNAECDATMESIRAAGVPVDSIEMDRITPENLGELILYYELLTSVVGALMEINTYDQPGVEEGKRILVSKFRS